MSTVEFAARHTCDSPEWYTPSSFVEAAREVMGGIDLDPASHEEANRTVKAARFFTAEDDGLKQPWAGRIFLNPPGAKDRDGKSLVPQFWRKLMAERESEGFRQAVWIGYSLEQLQTLQAINGALTPMDFPICITSRRIAFIENAAKKKARLEEIDAINILRKSRGEKLRPRNEDGASPSHSNYITYIGPNSGTFARVFAQFGKVR